MEQDGKGGKEKRREKEVVCGMWRYGGEAMWSFGRKSLPPIDVVVGRRPAVSGQVGGEGGAG